MPSDVTDPTGEGEPQADRPADAVVSASEEERQAEYRRWLAERAPPLEHWPRGLLVDAPPADERDDAAAADD